MKLPLNQRQDATVEQLREKLDEAMGDQERRWTEKRGWQPTRITAERDPKQFGDNCDSTWFGMIEYAKMVIWEPFARESTNPTVDLPDLISQKWWFNLHW